MSAKRYQAELANDYLLREVMEDARHGLLLTDATGVVIDANRKAAEMFDYEFDELTKHSLAQLFPKSFAEFEEVTMAPAASIDDPSPAEPIYSEVLGRSQSGTELTLNLSIQSIPGHDDELRLIKIADPADEIADDPAVLLDEILNSSGVATFILDNEFKVAWVNKAVEEYFGIRRQEVIGHEKQQLIESRFKHFFEQPERFEGKLLNDYATNKHVNQFECHVLGDGEREDRWLLHWSKPIESGPYRGGRMEHYTDITAQKTIEHRLRETEEQFRLMAEQSEAVIWLSNSDFTSLLFMNSQYEAVFGGDPDRVLDDPLNVLDQIHPDDHDDVERAIERLVEGGKVELEYRVKPSASDDCWVHAWGTPIKDDADRVKYLMGTVRDVTDQKAREHQLQTIARTDELTGLLNRKAIFERLKEETAKAIRYDSPLSFAILDLDHFKQINDRHGHLTGDEVLRDVARLLERSIRDVDIPGRYGGEEFAVIFPETDREEAVKVTERIRRDLESRTFSAGEAGVDMRWSGGVTAWKEGDETIEDLVGRADEALYTAKNQGRNRIVSL